MKMETTRQGVGHLKYETPALTSMSVHPEGILCQSDTTSLDETPDLQDYNPSNGAW